MSKRLVITGSAGLIGRRLVDRFRAQGFDVVEIDRRNGADGLDFRSPEALALCDRSINGVIHLAAVSRVAWAERDPALTSSINVSGTQRLLDHLRDNAPQAWFLFVSSREVYGEPRRLHVTEGDPLDPVNVYGRSKLAGEDLVANARATGRGTATIRLSNVYGGREDHPDRAVPSLAYRAVTQQTIHLTGGGAYFDFVHVDDVVEGLMGTAKRLSAGESNLPAVHLATGRATSLLELAQKVCKIAGGSSVIEEQPARNFDVSGFCGSPELAQRILGWEPTISLDDGLRRVIEDLRANGPLPPFPLEALQDSSCHSDLVEHAFVSF